MTTCGDALDSPAIGFSELPRKLWFTSAEVDMSSKSLLAHRWPDSIQLEHFRDICARIIEERARFEQP